MDLEQFARELSSASASITNGLEAGFRIIVKEIEETAKKKLACTSPLTGRLMPGTPCRIDQTRPHTPGLQ